ncbi:hypothetical protein Ahy_B03g064578 [Arachis hypogaea]|uniref:PB1-like domain-containing protein n=1 Tax=Arachis hypogaea TaxID=3818 RepID=A0A444ZZW9_ARAHY|nr:hypothetical protein Ahy_B03g064578 [Arachis hypogaea]
MKKQSTSTQVCPVRFSSPHTSDTSSRVIAERGCKVVGGLLLLVLHERSHLWSGDREVSFDKGLPFRMSYFSVKVYHHGSFGLEGGLLKYLGWETTVIDYCNEDEWSLIEVYDIVSRQGYLKKDIAAMWYKSLDQSTEEGLRMLRTDKDAMDMANIGVREDMEQAGGSNGPGLMVTFEAHSARPVEGNSGPNVEEKNVGEKDGKDESDEKEEGSDGSEDEDYTPKGGVDDSSDSWSSNSKNGYCSEDSAAEIVFGDSDDEKEGAEELVDVNIRVGDTFEAGTTETQTDAAKESRSDNDRGKEKIAAGLGDEEEGYESEDFLDVPIVGDDEDNNNVAKRYPLHKQLKDMSEYKWEIGTLYVSREEFKDCATAYAVHTGRGLRFDKVDLRRVKVTCVEGCNWFAYCGKMKNEQTWQLTSCHNKHSCSRELKIGIMHAKWLSEVFLNKIAENPKIKLSTLMKKAYSKWNVELTKSKAARVKQFALDELQGTYIEQYRRLYDYYHELLRSNPGSICLNCTELAADENPTRGRVSREGQNQKCSYCFARGHNKRTCPKKRKVAATASANKVAGSTRRASRIISSTSTISSTISSQGSKQSQAASKKTTVTRPKRKSSATDVSSQHSQAISKKAKLTPSTTNLRVLPSPSKNISKSQLKFMARTPPKAWKKM